MALPKRLDSHFICQSFAQFVELEQERMSWPFALQTKLAYMQICITVKDISMSQTTSVYADVIIGHVFCSPLLSMLYI